MRLPRGRLFFSGLLVTFGGTFHWGYQLSVVNPTEPVFQRFVNESFYNHFGSYLTDLNFRLTWSAIVSIMMIGGMIGSLLMPVLANKFGRKGGLFISSVAFIVSIAPCALAKTFGSFELFALGRLLVGVSSGLATGFQSIYLTECSPTEFRGLMGTLTAFNLEIGFGLGAIVGLPQLLGTDHAWPLMFCVEVVPSLLLLCALPFFHESPYFLVSQGKMEAARAALRAYHGAGANVEHVLAEMGAELAALKQSLGLRGAWRVRSVRNGMLLGVAANVAVGFSGVAALSFFAAGLLHEIGLSVAAADYANAAVAATAWLPVLVSGLWLVERFGRRTLLLLSVVVLGLVNVLILVDVLVYSSTGAAWAGFVFLAAYELFMLVFAATLGSIAFFITTELVPHQARSTAQGAAITAQYVAAFVAPVLFLPLEGFVGGWAFLLHAVPLGLVAVYFYLRLPETNNRSIADIQQSLGANPVAHPSQLDSFAKP